MVFHTGESSRTCSEDQGILNVFGVYVYDYTNDRMFIHSYKKRNSHQFLDFIRRVDSFYDSTIKRIFLVLDNISIYIKQRRGQRNTVSLSSQNNTCISTNQISRTKSNRGKRWMWMQRKAINNCTFTNEHDIGKTVNDWTENYNTTHGRRVSDILQIGLMKMITQLLSQAVWLKSYSILKCIE